jgi:hypothetical protein
MRLLLLTSDVHRPLEALCHLVQRHEILRGVPHATGGENHLLLDARSEVRSVPSIGDHESMLDAVIALQLEQHRP